MDIIGATQLNRRQIFFNRQNRSDSSNRKLKQISLSCHQTVKPVGRQGLSLTEPTRKTVNFLSHAIFGSNQLHFDRNSSKLEKAGVVAGQVRNIAGEASSLTLLGLRMASMGHMIKTGCYVIPNEGFHRSLAAFTGLSIVIGGLSFVRSTSNTFYQVIRDGLTHKKRAKTQNLLSRYNSGTRSFSLDDVADQREARRLLSDTRSDTYRSTSQVTLDRLTEVAGIAQQGTEVVNSALLFTTSKAVARVLPGLGIALSAISTVHSGMKTATQVNALNNLAKAKAATRDPLLTALAKHIKQERTLNARKDLANTAINLAGTVVSVGLTSSGVAAPAGYIATGAVGAGLAIGSSLFSAWHNRKLNKARENSGQCKLSGRALLSLASENIGIAEKALLARLRTSKGSELKETLEFLRTFGLAENTIKMLQLAPEHLAMKTLRDVLYQDKVKFKGLQLKQTVITLSHITGLTALAKSTKAGCTWLITKLKPDRKRAALQSLSHTPAVEKQFFLAQNPLASKRALWCVSEYQLRMYN